MLKPTFFFPFLFSSLFFLQHNATAQASLDPMFGSNGIVVTDFFTNNDDLGQKMLLQPNGHILLAGFSSNNFALARYSPIGALDPTFSGDGLVSTEIQGVDRALGAALQPDGKIVLAGSTNSTASTALVRYLPDGTLDPIFDLDGKVTVDMTAGSSGNESARVVEIQPDGKIIFAGFARHSGASFSHNDLAVGRLNGDGSLDQTFGTGGKVKIDVAGFGNDALDLAIQPDGKIVLAGSAIVDSINSECLLVRLHPNGSPDLSFGNNGIVLLGVNGNDRIDAVLVLENGDLLAAATSKPAGEHDGHINLLKFGPNGSLDLSFGNDGISIFTDELGSSDGVEAADLVLQPDGHILVTGIRHYITYLGPIVLSHYHRMMVARFLPDGTFDGVFSTFQIEYNGDDDTAYSIILQPDGKILVGGTMDTGSNYNFALARLLMSACQPVTVEQNPIICFGETFTLPNGEIVTEMAIYETVLTSVGGCDSTIYTVLGVSGPVVLVDSTIVADAGMGNGSIAIEVTGGVNVYQYLWSNGANASVVTGLPAGTYTVTVTEGYGCTAEFVFEVPLFSAADETADAATSVQVFPNPFSDKILINAPVSQPHDIREVRLCDFAGRVLRMENMPSSDVLQLETGDLPSGAYLLEVVKKDGKRQRQVVIKG